jgi:hypothetical protein
MEGEKEVKYNTYYQSMIEDQVEDNAEIETNELYAIIP